MATNLPSSVIYFPGSTTNIGPQALAAIGTPNFGIENDGTSAEQWIKQVDAFTNGGQMPEETTAR